MSDARLARIRVFPIKSLDGVAVDSAAVGTDGGLVPDRELALVDADGDYVNGKRTPAVHLVDATYDLDERRVSLAVADRAGDAGDDEREATPTGDLPEPATFSLDDDGGIAAWMTDYFGYEVRVEHREPSYPDDTTASGPTVVSTATLATVADWFDLTTTSVRRRFRANLAFDGVPAFWEDRLYGDRSEHVPFTVGEATFHGEGPCRRCVVPTRDPDTGEPTPSFRTRFVRRRRASLPDWSDGERFDGAFRLAVNTVVPAETRGRTVSVGDRVSRGEPIPAE